MQEIRANQASIGAAALFLAGAVIYGWVASHATTIVGFTDPMDYLFMADFYRSAFHGLDTSQHAAYYGATRFPPLFPMILGAAGAGSENQLLAAQISAATAILAPLAVYFWVLRESGSVAVSWAIALTTLLYPSYFLLNLHPVSEPLAMLLMAIALCLVSGGKVNRSRLLISALVIGLAPLARTAMLPLIIAFWIWMWLAAEQSRRVRVLCTVVSAAPLTIWTVYRKLIGSDSYANWLTAERFLSDLGGWPEVLWVQPARLFLSFVGNWWNLDLPSWVYLASGLLAALAAYGAALGILRNRIDAWFAGGYVAMILLWPFPHELGRFLVLLWPVLLVSAYRGALSFARLSRRDGGTVATALVVGLATLCSIPAWDRFAKRASLPVDELLLGDKREPLFFNARTAEDALFGAELYARGRILLEQAGQHIAEDQCVYATPPQLVKLYSRRTAYMYPAGLPMNPENAQEMLQQCEYFIVGGWGSLQLDQPSLYPHEALRGWTEAILISYMDLPDGRRGIAAMLLKRKNGKPVSATTAPTPQ